MKTHQATEGCLDQALSLVTRPGTALEFGVHTGRTLRRIVEGMPAGSRVVGFDSFDGLPEFWRDGFGVGTFRTKPPVVPGTELVIGLFGDTLPAWPVPKDVVLVHVDCDLYSSTRTVLENIGPHLKPGALIVFDEFHGWPGCENDGEARAWSEWAESTKVAATQLAKGPEQLLIRIEKES